MDAAGLDLAPFRGLRYAAERITGPARVVSPPYDVVVRPDGQRALETADPHNVVRLTLPPTPARAAATLADWRRTGVLVPDDLPALYVHEQRDPAGAVLQRGLVGALRLTPPHEGVVLPHEDVLPDVVAERAALLRATAADIEPLLLSYRDAGPALAALIDATAARPPLTVLTAADGITHRLWRRTDPAAHATAARALRPHRALIADGHHRWATALRVSREHGGRAPWDRTLVLLVDSARHPLHVRAIHRALPGLPPADALAALAGAFRVRRLDGPASDPGAALRVLDATPGTAFVIGGGGAFHLADRPDPAVIARTVPADRPAAWRGLDTTVLHATVINALWRVPDRPGGISYLHDAPSALDRAERSGGTAVLLRPVTEDVVRTLAGQGVTTPGKTTSFGPKPVSGLVLRAMADQTAHGIAQTT
ncbi:DUF1015 domain-containing protein [Streptomyces sp. RFCAC02]|uniref:DUF1015 family protein n=1 Tax=Streptomyces sp. RFCAC02 TaxID=2499143 RepID=UPI0010212377|nr:DUF1015 domain-containing protein [Streptomyces sp. RFCAC02]